MANLVLLTSDEHNPRYSSPYGHARVQTPRLQELAAAGVVFENAYCPSPLCLPSRAAFMAGKRVHQLQTYNNCTVNLDPSPQSYGAALAQQGVYTAYVGKTDVYASGEDLGFSEMLRPGNRGWPGDDNQRRQPVKIRAGAAKRADGFGPREDAGAGDAACVEAGAHWLETVAPRLAQPWVLVVNIGNPHFPHFAPPELWEEYRDCEDLPTHGVRCESARHPYACDLRAHFETEQFSEAQARGLRRGYLGCIGFVDAQLGRLVDAVCAAGLADTTNMVYTSDHGDMLGKFGMWWKCSLYEDSVRVPLIAAGPDFAAGQRVKTPVDLLDLQATMFACVGAERPADWVGAPLAGIAADDPERVVFAEYHGHGVRGSAYMVRRGRWKYLHCARAPHQLFDLEADPDELHNRYDAKPDVAAGLEAELRRICSPEDEQDRAEQFIEQQLATIAAASS